MQSVRAIALVFLTLFLVVAGCSSPSDGNQARASRPSIQRRSGLVRYPYDLSKRANRLSLSLTLHASTGSFLYTVHDPQDTVVWQGRVDTGQSLKETRTLKPVPGRWILTLSMENTSGNYDIVWDSR